jgi:alanine-synthesizing transaminase
VLDPAEIEVPRLSARAIVVINPNNPRGVYPRAVLEAIARIAEKHHLVVLADEIWRPDDHDGAEFKADGDPSITRAVRHVERAVEGLPGLRLSGWAVFFGDLENARECLPAPSC